MSDSDSPADQPPRQRRETSAEVLLTRAARSLVAPVHEKLGAWQAECIKLETMAQRSKAAGRRDVGLSEAARSLLGYVSRQAETFERSVESAPEPIRRHGRVSDTRMVLRRLEGRLAATLSDLGDPPAAMR